MSGATVRWARLTAMFGRPTPTKQTPWPASSRAAATIIISALLKVGSVTASSPIGAVVDDARRRRSGSQRRDTLGAQPLDIGGATVEIVDPVTQPGLGRGLVAADGIPVEIEPVVAVIRALDVRRVRPERLDDDGVDDQAGNDRPVRIGPDDRLVDQLLDDDDDALRGERRLLLAAEQAPDLGVAGGIGALRVDDRHIRLQRRD